MEIRKGLLKLTVSVGKCDEVNITIAVAAAPSVPSSPTSSMALWTTLETASLLSSVSPEKSASLAKISLTPSWERMSFG